GVYWASSASKASTSEIGSRPGSNVAQSTTCTSTAQRSMCRRKSRPSPRPWLAPGIRPGTSATVYTVSPAVTTPRLGINVVNGYSAIFGRAADSTEISEDLPAEGKPSRPTSATDFSSSTRSSSSPGSPSRAKPGALRALDASAALPRPPRPPRAATNVVPAPTRSASTSPSGVRTTVPSGTDSTRSSPAALAVRRPSVGAVVEVQQGVHPGVDDQFDVTPATAVATVRPTERLELLPVHRCAAIAATASRDVDGHAVNEPRHVCLQEEKGK